MKILKTKVERTVGEILVVAAVLAFAGYSIFAGFDSLRQRDAQRAAEETARVLYETELAAYNVALREYDTTVTNRNICIDGVERSDANRSAWTNQALLERGFADAIEAIGGERAVAFAEAHRARVVELIDNGPVLSSEPRDPNDCPTVPPIPVPPTREEF